MSGTLKLVNLRVKCQGCAVIDHLHSHFISVLVAAAQQACRKCMSPAGLDCTTRLTVVCVWGWHCSLYLHEHDRAEAHGSLVPYRSQQEQQRSAQKLSRSAANST